MNKKLSSGFDGTIGVGILSWRSHETLKKSLQSYEKIGFKNLFDKHKIIFQEMSKKDEYIANEYGYDYVGTRKNKGIQAGHRLIFENLSTDYVLILENDNPIIETFDICYQRLSQAIKYLENGKIDMMRLRHRWNFGEGFSLEKYLKYYTILKPHEKYNYTHNNDSSFSSFIKYFRRLMRPSKAIRISGYSLYVEENPEILFPNFIKKIDEDFFVVSSYIMPWTNQSVLIKRELYGELLKYAYNNPSSRTANGFQDLEKPLNCRWWRNKKFKIGVSEGIFTHNRFDDSWRRSHKAFNKELF